MNKLIILALACGLGACTSVAQQAEKDQAMCDAQIHCKKGLRPVPPAGWTPPPGRMADGRMTPEATAVGRVITDCNERYPENLDNAIAACTTAGIAALKRTSP